MEIANNYVDVKVTVWNRMHFEDDTDMQKIIKMIQDDGGVTNIGDEHGYSGECETLLDTEETLRVDKNEGYSTIEVYENDKTIWENGKNV